MVRMGKGPNSNVHHLVFYNGMGNPGWVEMVQFPFSLPTSIVGRWWMKWVKAQARGRAKDNLSSNKGKERLM